MKCSLIRYYFCSTPSPPKRSQHRFIKTLNILEYQRCQELCKVPAEKQIFTPVLIGFCCNRLEFTKIKRRYSYLSSRNFPLDILGWSLRSLLCGCAILILGKTAYSVRKVAGWMHQASWEALTLFSLWVNTEVSLPVTQHGRHTRVPGQLKSQWVSESVRGTWGATVWSSCYSQHHMVCPAMCHA